MRTFVLSKLQNFQPNPGPVVVCVMDGIGVGAENEGNAVHLARTPNLDWLLANCPHTNLRAHGTAVGLPSDEDMGNSEVGHNALGAGRVFDQGAKLVTQAISSGRLFQGDVWNRLVERSIKHDRALHFIGLLSDGNVHSHIEHLFAMIRRADEQGVKTCFVHPLLDGRDVPETSALDYIGPLESLLQEISNKNDRNYRIASGGGRMLVTMDRYNANWSVVKRGWDAHVHGVGRRFSSAKHAIETYRAEDPKLIDQNMSEFVIEQNGEPVGRVVDGDSVVFFNFRGDRAIEISRVFDEEVFSEFDRGTRPEVLFAGMMQYDGDLSIPKNYLVSPPVIERTLGELLAKNGIRQLAISETQKYGHVTYFWNGNRTEKFDDDLETYVCIPSDVLPFDERPWMKAAEITDRFIQELQTGKYQHMRLNFANGDMVGHTGVRDAAVVSVEAVDLCLGRLIQAVRQAQGVLIVTADHGNADEMYEIDKKSGKAKTHANGVPQAKTAHTLNPVPFVIFDPNRGNRWTLEAPAAPGLANVAATVVNLLGFESPEGFETSLIRIP